MDAINRSLELLTKGIKNPRRVPPWILSQVFPERYGKWRVSNGVITWNSFDWGDGENPAQISAINYHMVQALREDLAGGQFETTVEIGCGYGRVTPWLGEFSENVIGVEPNQEMSQYISDYYDDIEVLKAPAQDIPLGDGEADLVFTRSVFQHIPPEKIQDACDEVTRIAGGDAKILLCEAAEGESNNQSFWPRSPEMYEEMLSGFTLTNTWKRDAPAKTRRNSRMRMTFQRT